MQKILINFEIMKLLVKLDFCHFSYTFAYISKTRLFHMKARYNAEQNHYIEKLFL